ncbi:MAG: Glycine cleavage system protein [Bacteriovoracaceae bacterium]|nr:Glycine cleavage system protein [Bacteriovoracaceae bacterium]
MALKTTPLHAKHLELKARMAEFAGFDMPISYDAKTGGMLKEHLAVREHAGMFDVSHMGEFWVKGAEATKFLSYACSRGFSSLEDGRAQYCLLINRDGGIIDDIIVYRFSADKYWMVVNASNVTKDFAHLRELSKSFKVSLEDVSEQTALIAIQGPKAVELFSKIVPKSENLKYYSFMMSSNGWLVARTGYTGEDGFEIFLPNKEALSLWNEFESKDVVPIGLGARDTLRLEVGFPLYGHELSEKLRPMETFSAFATDLKNEFCGVEKARLPNRYLPIAVETSTPKPLRADEKLFLDSKPVGWITSGSISPLRRVGIGLALVDLSLLKSPLSNDAIFVLESAGKAREAVRTLPPFVGTPRVKRKLKAA